MKSVNFIRFGITSESLCSENATCSQPYARGTTSTPGPQNFQPKTLHDFSRVELILTQLLWDAINTSIGRRDPEVSAGTTYKQIPSGRSIPSLFLPRASWQTNPLEQLGLVGPMAAGCCFEFGLRVKATDDIKPTTSIGGV